MKSVLILTLQLAPFVAVAFVFALFALAVFVWPSKPRYAGSSPLVLTDEEKAADVAARARFVECPECGNVYEPGGACIVCAIIKSR